MDIIPAERIANKIYIIRNKKVMLDNDLAVLFGEEVKRLNQQVQRNIERFPGNFMFQINAEEYEILRSQIATSSWGGRRYLPNVFTEHGIVMLASVLKSKKAVSISIEIVNAFIKMREYLATHKEILEKLEKHDKNFVVIFKVLEQLTTRPKEPVVKKEIGFRPAGGQ